jgi:hypothetical protein
VERDKAELFEQTGRLKMELEWLKKKSPRSPEELRPLVEPGHPRISVRRQCELLSLSRSSRYYRAAGPDPEDVRLMRLLDEQYTARPFYGSRRMTAWLNAQARIDRLGRNEGSAASRACLIGPHRPRTDRIFAAPMGPAVGKQSP